MKYSDIPLSLASNYLYYSLKITEVDSRMSNLTYFQMYSSDEVIELLISSDGSYINARNFVDCLKCREVSVFKISQY